MWVGLISIRVHLISWESLRNSSLIFHFKPYLPTIGLLQSGMLEMGCNYSVLNGMGFISNK